MPQHSFWTAPCRRGAGVATATLLALVATPAAQTAQEIASFGDPTPADFEQLGWALDADGGTIVAGVPFDDAGGTLGGSAVVYEGGLGGWNPVWTLQPSQLAPGDGFGWSVAVDGNLIAVGSRLADAVTPGDDAGLVFVFARSGSAWVEEAVLAASDAAPGDQFGWAVDLEGTRLVVGAPRTDDAFPLDSTTESGAVYVFTRTASGWVEDQKLLLAGATRGDQLGSSVAVDADRVVAGAPGRGLALSNVGSVAVFRRLGPAWSQEDELFSPSPASNDSLGASVAIAGPIVAAGAPSAQGTGAVLVWRLGSTWQHEATLVPPGVYPGHLVGSAVALDGNRLLCGAPAGSAPQVVPGSAHLWSYDGSSWSYGWRYEASDGSVGDRLGSGVALDCGTAVVGAPFYDGGGIDFGRAYVFDGLQPPQTHCTAKVSSGGCLPAIASSGSPNPIVPGPFLLTATQVPPSKAGMLLYGMSGPAALPFAGGILCVAPPLARGPASSSTPGAACAGTFQLDFKAWVANDPSFLPGSDVDAQWWFRDPGDANLVGLTDAIGFSTCP